LPLSKIAQVCRQKGPQLAEISRTDLVSGLSQGLEKLGRDQVNRPQIGKARLPACEVPVSNEGARMGIALDAMAFHQHDDVALRRLAEMVNPIGGDRYHRA
jgi:hypothetical protein